MVEAVVNVLVDEDNITEKGPNLLTLVNESDNDVVNSPLTFCGEGWSIIQDVKIGSNKLELVSLKEPPHLSYKNEPTKPLRVSDVFPTPPLTHDQATGPALPLSLSASVSVVDAPLVSVARFYSHFRVGTMTVTGLLDGGAMINCLDVSIVTSLREKHPELCQILPHSLGHVGTANKDGSVNVVGRIILPCVFGKVMKQITFAVCEGLSSKIILGRPFSYDYVDCLMEQPPQLRWKDGTTWNLTTSPDTYTGQVKTIMSLVIPPGSVKRIVAKISQPLSPGMVGLVFPTKPYSRMLVHSMNVVRRAHNVIVELHNDSLLEEILIPQGAVIGTFEGIPHNCNISEMSIPKSMLLDPVELDKHLISVCGVGVKIDDIPLSSSLSEGEARDKDLEDRQSRTSESIVDLPKVMRVHRVVPPEIGCRSEVGVATPPPLVLNGQQGIVGPSPSDTTDKGDLPWGMTDPGWTPEQRALVVTMLSKVKPAFQSHELDHGFVKGYEVGIDTGDAPPVVLPAYRMVQAKLAAGRKLVKEFLIMRIIEPSKSAWRSPLLLIVKPDGSYRMTTDLRGLNSVTRKDQFPLPRIDDMLEKLKGAVYMAKLDLRNAFFQIMLKREDREKTAFTFDGALYQYRALPQGLVHSPANLCRIMHALLNEYSAFALPYMDDVAIIGSTFEEVVENCGKVFHALGSAGMKIAGKKTIIGVREMTFLGHKITPDGILPDPHKVKAITEWSRPITVTQLRQFLGLTNYLRKFIQNYAQLANGLSKQTGGERHSLVVWDEGAIKSFEDLKAALTSTHVLRHPDFSPEGGLFKVRVDASKIAEGGVLYQEQDGVDRVIGYASRVFSPSERRSLSNPERESHAIMWALTHVWRHILLGRSFEVYSDHKPCLALKGLSKLTNERMQRWAAALATYDYKAYYAKGESMKDCDPLSRAAYIEYDRKLGTHPADKDSKSLDVEAVHMDVSDVSQVVKAVPQGCTPPSIIEVIHQSLYEREVLSSLFPFVNSMTTPTMITQEKVRRAQLADPLLHDVICHLQERYGDMKKTGRGWKNRVSRLANRSDLEDGTLYSLSGPLGHRLWVPSSLRSTVMHDFHDVPMAGHMGVSRTYQRIHFNYYWMGMRKDIENWVLSCEKCARFNHDPHAKVRSAQYTGPTDVKAFERVSMDVMGPFPESEKGMKYLFTITDLATRWCEVIPIVDQTAATLAEQFLHRFCLQYGPPRTILTDQGSPFLSELLEAICQLLQVQHHVASAYHPQTNGVAERAHAVFQAGMAKLVNFSHNDWDKVLPYVLHAYRCTPHAITGYSPYYLVYGQECPTFLDLQLLPEFAHPLRQPEWTKMREEVLARLRVLRNVGNQNTAKFQEKQADPSTPLREFEVGDFVRIRNMVKQPRHGLVTKWRPNYLGPYVVKARTGPTEYTVQNVENHSDIRKYNVNDLKAHREFALRSTLFSKACPAVPVEVSAPEFHMDETEVERVENSKLVGDAQYYLVKFKGLDEAFRMWLPVTLMKCPKLISAYHQRARVAHLPPPRLPLPPTPGFKPPRPRARSPHRYIPPQTSLITSNPRYSKLMYRSIKKYL